MKQFAQSQNGEGIDNSLRSCRVHHFPACCLSDFLRKENIVTGNLIRHFTKTDSGVIDRAAIGEIRAIAAAEETKTYRARCQIALEHEVDVLHLLPQRFPAIRWHWSA